MSRHLLIILTVLALSATSLTACGKRGDLEAPTEAGKDSPREYPIK
jgi:predicted small lipoprotein YifL